MKQMIIKRANIPALHLLGAKKWWKEKHLLQFGIEFCDLSRKEAITYKTSP